MKRQLSFLLAILLLAGLLSGCGSSGKKADTADQPTPAPTPTAAAAVSTQVPEPKTIGDLPDADAMIRCYADARNTNFGVQYDASNPLPNGFDGVGDWYPVTNYGSLNELRRYVQQYLGDALIDRLSMDEALREIDGRLYWRQGGIGYVSYRVDKQTEVLRYAEGDAYFGAKCYLTYIPLYGSGDNYCGDDGFIIGLCSDGHYRILSVAS